MKIALAGNPNCGKTTMFNALTGRNERVGNWSGVTVDKKEASIKHSFAPEGENLILVDLPGAYSLSTYSTEESIAKDFILQEKPDVIINIVDATNLNRSLFLTTQLLELNIPVVVALNKIDLAEKKGNRIDVTALSEALKVPVVCTVSTRSSDNGLPELIKAVLAAEEFGQEERVPFVRNDRQRYAFINELVRDAERKKLSSEQQTLQDKVDRIVAHKWLGIPIFAAVIYLVFSISQAWLGLFLADFFVGWIDKSYEAVASLLGEDVNPVLAALLLDGIIGGVGAVIGFLPLIMVLFFCLALLEDCGYMARVAVVMDRFFKKVGLSGKSIIPVIIGTGCAIPGIMSTRTIKNIRQRRTTAMLTPYMPCGAKLSIIALFAGVFFADNAWVGTSMYFLGIILVFVGALIIRKITGDYSKSYFIMELPEYRIPSVKRAVISVFGRAKAFIIKAGTIILVCNAVVHLLQTFDWKLQVVAESAPETSILASIAMPLAVLFVPLGFGMWQFAAAAVTGFIAKENVVGTLAVTFAITNFFDMEELALVEGGAEVGTILGISSVAALAYLVFNLFTPPCFAAIGAMNSEMESRKWLVGAIAFQLGVGYTLAFLVYQFGTLFTTGSVGEGFGAGLLIVSAIVATFVILMRRGVRKHQIRTSVQAVKS